MSNFYDVFVHYLAYIVGFISIGVGRILCALQPGPLDQALSVFLMISGILIIIFMIITEIFMFRRQN